MFKRNKEMKKQGMGRLLSFLLALAIVVMPLSAGLSTTASANVESTSIELVGNPVIGNNNYDVTLTFDGPVQVIDEDWADKIDVRASYEGTFQNARDDYDAYSEIDGNTVIIHLDYDLSGDKNQIRIRDGAFEGQNGVILSPEFAALDVANPTLDSSAISSDLKTVTLTLDKAVTKTSVTEYVYDFVRINGSQLTSESPEIVNLVNGNQIEIVFATAQSGNLRIDISSGALKSANGIINSKICARLDLSPIGFYTSSVLSNTSVPNSEIDLYFNHSVLNNLSGEGLKTAITITKDANTPIAFTANDSIVVVGGRVHLHFFNSLTPGSYVVNFAAGALKDTIGLVARGLTSGTIEISDRIAPVYQGFEVSPDRTQVTLSFNESLKNNYGYYDNYNFASNVYFTRSENPNDWYNLNDSGGSAVISSQDNKKVIITFNGALTGSQNKISISSNTFKDQYNNVLNTGVTTAFIDVSRTAPPKYVSATIDNLNHDYTIYFDKKIKNNLATLQALHDVITVDTNERGFVTLDTNTTVSVVDNKVVLHFVNPLADRYISIKIPADSIADEKNNVLANDLVTDSISPNDFYQPEMNCVSLISQHSVRINFNTNQGNLADNTINGSGSHLKDFVKYSTDKGATFSSLQLKDAVTLDPYGITVYFANVIEGNLQIKVIANALKDTTGVVRITDAVTSDINTTSVAPYLTGSLFTNVPSVFTFDDNATWRSKIQKVVLVDGTSYWSERTLVLNEEYTISAGKLTILPGVLESNGYYYIDVHSDGFDNRQTRSMDAINSQDSYYITPAQIDADKTDGITARVKFASNQSYGPLTVIFQLMNGQTAVSISKIGATFDYYRNNGEFTANFNVADAATNPNYTVRAYVVSEYSSSPLSVGVNLATQISDAEYDLLGIGHDVP